MTTIIISVVYITYCTACKNPRSTLPLGKLCLGYNPSVRILLNSVQYGYTQFPNIVNGGDTSLINTLNPYVYINFLCNVKQITNVIPGVFVTSFPCFDFMV